MRATVRRVDERFTGWLASTDHGAARPLLTVTARASDLLVPWIAVSVGVLGARMPHATATLVRGWSAIALSSVLEDAVIKPLTHRRRPPWEQFPAEERRHTSPSTSGFPSGHAGAATAFTVATRHAAPQLRRTLTIIAVVVSYSRIYTGRHYLSDALAGAALGAGAGAVVRRLAPLLADASEDEPLPR